MKNGLLLIVFTAKFFLSTLGQNIPNGNFESWEIKNSTLQPTSWATTNLPGFEAISRVTPGYNGTIFAARISEENLNGTPVSGEMKLKFACNQRPISVTGAYRVLPQAGDSVYLIISVTLSNKITPIGYFTVFNLSYIASSEFTPFSYDFYYARPDAPDTARFTIGMYSKHSVINSAIEIDELKFSNAVDGTIEKKKEITIGNIYPLPANNYISIPINLIKPTELKIEIFDLSGNKLQSFFKNVSGSCNLEINVNNIASGAYIISLENSDFRNTRKFIISR
jgi:hypothetical protein